MTCGAAGRMHYHNLVSHLAERFPSPIRPDYAELAGDDDGSEHVATVDGRRMTQNVLHRFRELADALIMMKAEGVVDYSSFRSDEDETFFWDVRLTALGYRVARLLLRDHQEISPADIMMAAHDARVEVHQTSMADGAIPPIR